RRVRGRHLGLLLADAGPHPRHAAGGAGAGVPATGPVRKSRVMSAGRLWALHICVLLGLFGLGFLLPAYHHSNLSRIFVLATFAVGYNIAFGYTGLLSLGHALLFGAGLYA